MDKLEKALQIIDKEIENNLVGQEYFRKLKDNEKSIFVLQNQVTILKYIKQRIIDETEFEEIIKF